MLFLYLDDKFNMLNEICSRLKVWQSLGVMVSLAASRHQEMLETGRETQAKVLSIGDKAVNN